VDTRHRPSLFSVRFFALILIAATWAGWTWQTNTNQQSEIDKAERLTQALAQANAAHIEGLLRSVRTLLEEFDADLFRSDNQHARLWLSERLVLFPEIRTMILVDRDGGVLGAPIGRKGYNFPLQAQSVADRDYFRRIKQSYRQSPVVLGQPVTSKFNGVPSFPMARAVQGPQGDFAGAVVVGIDPSAFRDSLKSGAIPAPGGAALFLKEGATFLARVPKHDDYLGDQIPSSRLFTQYLPTAPTAVIRLVSVADGNDKILAYRSLEAFPLVVTSWMTMSQVLTSWKEQMLREATVLTLATALVLILAWRVDFRHGQNRRLMQELAHERDTLEQQVSLRTRHLQERNAELEQFSHITSHDLQEPLRGITSFSQLLQRKLGESGDSETQEYLGYIIGSSKRLSALFKDFLAYSTLEQQGPEKSAICDLAPAVEKAWSSQGQHESWPAAELTIDPIVRTLKVVMPPRHLDQLLRQLLDNALKFAKPEGPVKVRLAARIEPGNMAHITIADNGIGIDPQYHDRIFRIFQRLHPPSATSGTGIGLALCRRVVELAGGRIWVDSAAGQGATFHCTLPTVAPPVSRLTPS